MRALVVLATTAIVLGLSGPSHAQDAPVGVDVFIGGHIFSTRIELGVDDAANVPSPKSFGLLGLRLGYHFHSRLALEIEAIGIPTKSSFDDDRVYVLGARAQLALLLVNSKKLHLFAVAGGGMLMSLGNGSERDQIDDDLDEAIHYGAGLRVKVSNNMYLRADGRHLLVPSTADGELTNDFELHVGLAWRFGGKKAEPEPEPEPELGPPADTDGDGISDGLDRCANEPEDKDGFEDQDGCPDPDNDEDGIEDVDDKCPVDAETRNGIDDDDGCPETDFDGDGLLGSMDKCPEQGEDRDGFQDDDGCPDPDNDGDGVLDADDRCPQQLETRNGFKDNDGCPDKLPRAIRKFTGVIAGIQFRKNRADIRSKSFRTLKRAVKVLKEYPDIRLEISGHTSSEGDRDKNVELSWQRAEAVKNYMVEQGIDDNRIETVGHGPDKPRTSNKRSRGRKKNRRIEFRILTQEAAPGAEAEGGGATESDGE